MARFSTGIVLIALCSGCVPADPPQGIAAKKQRALNGERSQRSDRIDDEDKSGAAPGTAPPPRSSVSLAASSSAASSSAASSSAASSSADRSSRENRAVFRDSFDRQELGPNWLATSPVWRIDQGRLCAAGARNHPAWLKRTLPTNARIEFDATSASSEGDLKVELWGDGVSGATSISYNNATSYLIIFGGWKNSFHVLARLNEHDPGRQQLIVGSDNIRARAVEPNQVYHFKVERADGKTIRWLVDDIELFAFTDPQPLIGAGHDHFGFNDWDVPVCFDNLELSPL